MCLRPIVSAINICQEIEAEHALKRLLVDFMLISNRIRSHILNKLFLKSACFFFIPRLIKDWELKIE